MAERVQVIFEAEDVPAMGYKVYVLEENEECLKSADCQTENIIQDSENILKMENKFISVQINEDGSYDINRQKRQDIHLNILVSMRIQEIWEMSIFTFRIKKEKTVTTENKAGKDYELKKIVSFVS